MPAAAQLDKLLHKALVPVGLRPPEPVVVVGGGQAEAELFPQAVEDVKHGHRVRPAGHGAQHRSPRGDQVLLPDKAFYLSQHSGACLSVQGRHAAARWSMDACQSTGVISVIR